MHFPHSALHTLHNPPNPLSNTEKRNKSTHTCGYNLSASSIHPSIFLSDMTQRVIHGVQLLLCWCPEGEWVWQALEVTFMQWVAMMVLHHFRVWRDIIRTPTSGVEWHPWTAEEQVWHTVLQCTSIFSFFVSSSWFWAVYFTCILLATCTCIVYCCCLLVSISDSMYHHVVPWCSNQVPPCVRYMCMDTFNSKMVTVLKIHETVDDSSW